MDEHHTCGQCYYFNWKTMLQRPPEYPECRLKIKTGYVDGTDPVCKQFEPKRRADNG